MTAPLLNLPIFAAAAPAGGQAAPAAGGAAGFEALMAAFFAASEGEGEGMALTSAESEESEGAATTEANGAPPPPVDAQTLAALLAVTPQAAPVAPAPNASAETEDGETPLQGAASAPPPAFAALMGQAVDTRATASADAEAAAVDTAATATETEPMVDDALHTPVSDIEAQPNDATEPTPPGREKSREPQFTPAADNTQAKGAPPAHAAAAAAQAAPAPAAQPQQPTPPQPVESAVDAVVQAEAVASEAEVPSEPAKAPGANRPGKSDGARRATAPAAHGAHAAAPVSPAHDTAMRPVDGAPASETDVQTPAIEGEAAGAAAPAPREAKASDADAPDAQAAAAPPAPSHHASATSAEAALPVRGSPETVANLAAQIVKKLEGRSTRFDVELNPAGLGQVSVAVEIGAHGRMTAALSFETPQAAAELRARAGELQKALEQAGFDLSGGALSFDVAGDRGQGRGDFGQQQQQQQHDGGAWRGRAFQAVLDTAGEAADAAANAALYLHRGSTSGVDVRV